MSNNIKMKLPGTRTAKGTKLSEVSTVFCCCCQDLRRSSSVLPFTTLWSENFVRFQTGPGRVLNVLHLPTRKVSSSQRVESEEIRRQEDLSSNHYSPSCIKSDKQSFRTLTTDSSNSSDEEGKGNRVKQKLPNTVLVKVELERPRTTESSQSRLSLPPLTTPPLTPIQKVCDKANIATSRKVRWRIRRSKRRDSLPPLKDPTAIKIAQNSSKIKERTWEQLKEMDKIESLPSVVPQDSLTPEPATPLFQRRLSPFVRPRSAKSTFGEVWHLEASNADIQKCTVFFIHGVGACFQIWKHQIRCLSEHGYEIVAVDLIGHGKSCVPKAEKHYRFERIRKDVTTLFDRYAKDTNVVIAHSYGTCFAVILAREREDRVTHLVLISSGAPTPLSSDTIPVIFPNFMIHCLTPFIHRNFKRLAFFTLPNNHDFNIAFGINSLVLKHVLDGQDWAEGDFAYHRSVKAQTLLIYGCDDGFVTLDEMQQMRRAIPDSHLEVVENASHMIMLEAPDQVNKLILDFVQLPVQVSRETGTPLHGRRQSQRPASSLSRILPHVKLLSL